MNLIQVHAVDYHTAGEPFRIVSQLSSMPAGSTVRERRSNAPAHLETEQLRRLLCHEPRGHADMYGCFLVPPNDPGAEFGALFWHKDGFSTACGHGTMALGAWAVESGQIVPDATGSARVVIDVPSGRVSADVRCEGGIVESVSFRNVPSYVLARDVRLTVCAIDALVDVSYGGAIYASMPASAFGLTVTPQNYRDLITAGRAVKAALSGTSLAEHPDEPSLGGIYGVILYDDLGDGPLGPHQRNVTVFADGQVDRSPCGSGSSARVAILAEAGRMQPGDVLLHESIVGSQFDARFERWVQEDGVAAVDTMIAGQSFKMATHEFNLDARDVFPEGFVLR